MKPTLKQLTRNRAFRASIVLFSAATVGIAASLGFQASMLMFVDFGRQGYEDVGIGAYILAPSFLFLLSCRDLWNAHPTSPSMTFFAFGGLTVVASIGFHIWQYSEISRYWHWSWEATIAIGLWLSLMLAWIKLARLSRKFPAYWRNLGYRSLFWVWLVLLSSVYLGEPL